MQEQTGPIYEVTLSIDRDHADDIDTWLAAHVKDMLLQPGFAEASIFALEDENDRVRRVTHYHVESDAALEQYIAGPAATMRKATIDKFGDHVDTDRRILRNTNSSSKSDACLNCGHVLTGQYCRQCGQRAQSRLISLWELIKDGFGDLLELDSRIWRTLIPLAVRPGQLTRDYLRGRRARFMPPIRMYLVLSLLFFLIAFFDPQDSLSVLFEPEPLPTPEEISEPESEPGAGQSDPAQEGIEAAALPTGYEADSESAERCTFDSYDLGGAPQWVARRFARERVQIICQRLFVDDEQGASGFVDNMLENVPIGLFLLLPLMALVLNILYPLSKRYYVEHLLFVVHYHSFIFLTLIAQIVWIRLAALIGLPDIIIALVVLAASLYIGVYLYKAMRIVYGQRHWITAAKFVLLFFAYSIGLALILAFAGIFAAFSL